MHQVVRLLRVGIVRPVLVADDDGGERLQSGEIHRPVECALGSRGLGVQAKAERAGAVVGRVEQVVHLVELSFARASFDHAPALGIQACVAQHAEHPVKPGRRIGLVAEFEVQRIDRHGAARAR